MALVSDTQINVHATSVLANLSSDVQQVSRITTYLSKILEILNYTQIRYDWESAFYSLVPENKEIETLENETSEMNSQFIRILANLLTLSTDKEQTLELLLSQDVIKCLIYFARSHDNRTKEEACRALSVFCEHPSTISLIVEEAGISPIITVLSADALTDQGLRTAVKTISEHIENGKSIITLLSEQGQDVLISLLECGDPGVERGAAMCLAAAVKNEQYKARIVSLGGFPFLSRLMQLVKEKKTEVQRSVDSGELQILEKIGEGVSGVVSKCIFQGMSCAVKKFNEENIAFDEEEFNSELAIMSVLRHPNVVNSLGGCNTKGNLFIISIWYKRGSLADCLGLNSFAKNLRISIDLPTSINLLIDAADGMKYLHDLNIIHRDLKAGNLLLTDDMRVCVTDFGVSRLNQTEMSKAAGTPMYMSPEILKGGKYDFSADVYAYAFVIWEVFNKKLPYEALNPWQITKGVTEEDLRPPLTECIIFKDLTSLCWHKEVKNRPTFENISQYLNKMKILLQESGPEMLATFAVDHLHILYQITITKNCFINLKTRKILKSSDSDSESPLSIELGKKRSTIKLIKKKGDK